jgi:transposase-like protein
MALKLHANATTTPRARAYIRQSRAPVAALARELGVSATTIRRWRRRHGVPDRSHTPRRLAIRPSPLEERLVGEPRRALARPLDDITEVMRRGVNPRLSRRAIHRGLVRHGLDRRPRPVQPPSGRLEAAPGGCIPIDLKHLPALERQKSDVFVAIDRATRHLELEAHPRRDAAAAFLERFLARFPHPVRTILTDNGSGLADRFAVAMKGKPSGRHPFDAVCARHGIAHRLTRPFRPRSNGLVERFNRRLAEAIGRQPKRGIGHSLFASHAERDPFLHRFVQDSNRTRLRCLAYRAPLDALTNPTGHNT